MIEVLFVVRCDLLIADVTDLNELSDFVSEELSNHRLFKSELNFGVTIMPALEGFICEELKADQAVEELTPALRGLVTSPRDRAHLGESTLKRGLGNFDLAELSDHGRVIAVSIR